MKKTAKLFIILFSLALSRQSSAQSCKINPFKLYPGLKYFQFNDPNFRGKTQYEIADDNDRLCRPEMNMTCTAGQQIVAIDTCRNTCLPMLSPLPVRHCLITDGMKIEAAKKKIGLILDKKSCAVNFDLPKNTDPASNFGWVETNVGVVRLVHSPQYLIPKGLPPKCYPDMHITCGGGFEKVVSIDDCRTTCVSMRDPLPPRKCILTMSMLDIAQRESKKLFVDRASCNVGFVTPKKDDPQSSHGVVEVAPGVMQLIHTDGAYYVDPKLPKNCRYSHVSCPGMYQPIVSIDSCQTKCKSIQEPTPLRHCLVPMAMLDLRRQANRDLIIHKSSCGMVIEPDPRVPVAQDPVFKAECRVDPFMSCNAAAQKWVSTQTCKMTCVGMNEPSPVHACVVNSYLSNQEVTSGRKSLYINPSCTPTYR